VKNRLKLASEISALSSINSPIHKGKNAKFFCSLIIYSMILIKQFQTSKFQPPGPAIPQITVVCHHPYRSVTGTP